MTKQITKRWLLVFVIAMSVAAIALIVVTNGFVTNQALREAHNQTVTPFGRPSIFPGLAALFAVAIGWILGNIKNNEYE